MAQSCCDFLLEKMLETKFIGQSKKKVLVFRTSKTICQLSKKSPRSLLVWLLVIRSKFI